MKTPSVDPVNHALVRVFTNYLLKLNRSEFTLFYCESCYERLNTDVAYRPGSPYNENTGICTHCGRCDDVSSPHLNWFMNKHGLSLERKAGTHKIDPTAILIWNWLVPHDYAFGYPRVKGSKQEVRLSWVEYGRTLTKQVKRCAYLSETSQNLLLNFYQHRFQADRLTFKSTNARRSLLVESVQSASHRSARSIFA